MANLTNKMSDTENQRMYGLELLEKTVENDIKRKEDNYVVLFHWVLVKEGFRCIGTGDAKEVSGDETQSELLPEGWNENETYLLRYIRDGKLFIARISKTGDDLLFSLVRGEDLKISSVIVEGKEQKETMDKNEAANKFEKELVQPLKPPSPNLRDSTLDSLRSEGGFSMDPLRGGRYGIPPEGMGRPDLNPVGGGMYGIPPDGRGIGRSDLDPLGGFGSDPGGMIFPFPGSRPSPGIRFDPINPGQGPLFPRGQRRWPSNPDNDEFQPPGGGYYM